MRTRVSVMARGEWEKASTPRLVMPACQTNRGHEVAEAARCAAALQNSLKI